MYSFEYFYCYFILLLELFYYTTLTYFSEILTRREKSSNTISYCFIVHMCRTLRCSHLSSFKQCCGGCLFSYGEIYIYIVLKLHCHLTNIVNSTFLRLNFYSKSAP